MKALVLLASLFASTFAFATPVDGSIIYKLPSGDLVKRVVTLEVPSRGQGEVVLSGERFEWRTSDFKTVVKKGKTTFIAVFKTEFMQFKSTIVLKGAYLKGTNKIIYYGDMYKKNGYVNVDEAMSGFTYSGGFKFEFDR